LCWLCYLRHTREVWLRLANIFWFPGEMGL
jgi:hypothetical protein